jgi:hypothetical protein
MNTQSLLAAYDALLTDKAGTWRALLAAFSQHGLGGEENPFAYSLRPRLLPRRLGDEINRKISILAGAVSRFASLALDDDSLLDAVGLTPLERELARAPAPPGIGLTRVDGFIDGENFRIVEWNGGCPAGGGYIDRASRAYRAIQPFQDFAKDRAISYQPATPGVLENLLDRYRAQGGPSERPRIAVVDFAGLSTADEHEIFRAYFAAQGFPAEIVPPEHLAFQRGRLEGPNGAIDIVYRRLVTRDYLPKLHEIPAIADAARAGAATIVDPFRTEVIHKKSYFAILSDPAFARLYSAEEREVIAELVPWTRRTLPQHTPGPDGATIDLLDYAQKNAERLVLKPNDSYGGKGVVLGWEHSASEWENALADAFSRGDYVLQARIATPRSVYPVVTPSGEVVETELLEDLCPYLAEATPHGFLCRASHHSLGNVSAGAFALPVFFVE